MVVSNVFLYFNNMSRTSLVCKLFELLRGEIVVVYQKVQIILQFGMHVL